MFQSASHSSIQKPYHVIITMSSVWLKICVRNPALSLAECESPLRLPVPPSLPGWLWFKMAVESALPCPAPTWAKPRRPEPSCAVRGAGRAAMSEAWSVSFLLRSKMADLPATPPAATRGTGYIVERWYRTGPSSTKWCQPISADIATVKRGIHIPDIPFLQVTMGLVPLVQHSQPA